MNFLPPLALPFLTGFFLTATILRDSKIPNKVLFLSACSLPVGLGVVSLILFGSCLAFSQHGPEASFIVSVLLLLILTVISLRETLKIWRSRGQRLKDFQCYIKTKWQKTSLPARMILVFLSLLFAVALFSFSHFFLLRSLNDFYGGWDGRYFWNLKAKFFFRAPSEWKGMFHPALTWSHPDYPLLVPGAVAWGWNWMRVETLAWPSMVGYVFSLSLCFFVIWYLASFVSAGSGMLAGAFLLSVPAYRLWSAVQYADVPLAFFITASALTLVTALRTHDAKIFLIAGLFAGLGAWTKNEGLSFFWILVCCLVLARQKKSCLLHFLLGSILFLLAIFYLKVFLDSSGNEFLNSRRDPTAVLSLLFDPWRIKLVLGSYLFFAFSAHLWNGLWIPFLAALVLRKVNSLFSLNSLPAFLVIAQEMVYFFILLITPYNLAIQIQTALTRLMLHTAPLALVFAVEALTRIQSPRT